MSNFYDPDIRAPLLTYLKKSLRSLELVTEEVSVADRLVIMDVVALHRKSFHGYEIKGDRDHIHRAVFQAQYFDLVFPKVTMVTTARYVQLASNRLPDYWGVLVAREASQGVVFDRVRPASRNPNVEVRRLLLSLWKAELLVLGRKLKVPVRNWHTRNKLAGLIAPTLKVKEAVAGVLGAWVKRYRQIQSGVEYEDMTY